MFGLFKKKEPPRPQASEIVPRIKNAQFRAYLDQQGIPAEQQPVIEPLVADLSVTYAFDMPGGFMMVMPYHVEELGLDRSRLRELALENVRARVRDVKIVEKDGVHRAVTGESYEACTILSSKVWSQAAAGLPGGLFAVVPSRDVVLFCDAASTQARQAVMANAMLAHAAGENHALSLQPLRWTDSGWIAEPVT